MPNLNKKVLIAFNENDWKLYERAAELTHMPSVSAYIRKAAILAAENDIEVKNELQKSKNN